MSEAAEETEKLNLESVSKNGGARPGAGRKPGQLSAATIEKNRVLDEIKLRVQKNAQRLFDAALTVALGTSYLYVIRKDEKGNRQKAEMITSPSTIQEYLDGDFDANKDKEYYFITTDKPDTKTINDLYDRAFGKSVLAIDANVNHNFNEVIEGLDAEYNPDELEETSV